MNPLLPITVAGESVWLLRRLPYSGGPGSTWFSAAFSLPLALGSSLSSREERRPLGARFNISGRMALLLRDLDLPLWREARQTMAAARLGLPFWPALGTTKVVPSPWWIVVDSSGAAWVYDDATAPASVSGTQRLMPLLLVRLTREPSEQRVDASSTLLRLDWETDGQATWLGTSTESWQDGPTTSAGATHLFPLRANWASRPTGMDPWIQYERRKYGARRESAVEAYPQPALRSLEQSVQMDRPGWIRLLAFLATHQAASFWVDVGTQEARLAASIASGGTSLNLDSAGTLGAQRALLLDDLGQRRVVLATSTASNPVPLASAPGAAFAAGTMVRAAALARFAQAEINLEWRSPDHASARLRFQEVGWELLAPGDETISTTLGALPRTATLFEIQIGAEIWRYTNAERALTLGGNTYTPEHLEWSSIEERLNLERISTTLSGRWNAAGPFARLWPFRVEAPITVLIREGTYNDAGEVTASVILFRGEVETFEPSGARFNARCSALASLLGRSVPARPVGTRCPWTFCDGNGRCGASRATWEVAAVVVGAVSESSAVQVQSSGAAWTTGTFAAHRFANGELTAAAVSRLVADSTAPNGSGIMTLTLTLPVTLAAGASVGLLPGCDGDFATCTGYSQTATFGGAPFIPPRNLLEFQPKKDGSYGGKK